MKIFEIVIIAIIVCWLASAGCNQNDEDTDIPPGDDTENDDNGSDDDTGGCVDNDKDGWCASQDCNDNSYSIHPGASEDCGDGLDNDCNGFSDSDDPACADDDVQLTDDVALNPKIAFETAAC
jgi:hypothetical protein